MSTMTSMIPSNSSNNNNNNNNNRSSSSSRSVSKGSSHRTPTGSSDMLIASASSNFSPMYSYASDPASFNNNNTSSSGSGIDQLQQQQQQQYANFMPSSSSSSGAAEPERRNSRSECIHSGHFMVSEIDESEAVKSVDDTEKSDSEATEAGCMATTETVVDRVVCQESPQEYTYGPINEPRTVTIDSSLSRLLQCMTLAYEERKLVSPKWNSFKGLRLKLKDKIRLNNIIWRCWHMQYKTGRKPPVCQFATMTDVHNKPEAVLLEGKYWRRGQDAVKAEYLKWRMNHPHAPTSNRSVAKRMSLALAARGSASEYGSEASFSPQNMGYMHDSISMDEEELMNWSMDTSVLDLLQPGFGFPSQREIARSGFTADLIQPSLSQLQPPFKDFFDDDIFANIVGMSRSMSILPPLPEEQDPAALMSNTGQMTSITSVPQQQQQQQHQSQQQQAAESMVSDSYSVPAGYQDQTTMSNMGMVVQQQPRQLNTSAVSSSAGQLAMDYGASSSPAGNNGMLSSRSRNKKPHISQQQAHQHQQQQRYSEVTSQFAQMRPNELPLSVYNNGNNNKSIIQQQQQHQPQALSANCPYDISGNMYHSQPQAQQQQQSSNAVSDRSTFAIPQSPAVRSPSQVSRALTPQSSYSSQHHNSGMHHPVQQQHQHHAQPGFQSSGRKSVSPSLSSNHVSYERSASLPVYSKSMSSSLGSLPQDYSFPTCVQSATASTAYAGAASPAHDPSSGARESSLIALLSNSSSSRHAASLLMHAQQQQQQQQQSYLQRHQHMYQQQRQPQQSLSRSHSFSPVSSATSSPSLSTPSKSTTTYQNYVPIAPQSSAAFNADMNQQQPHHTSTSNRTASPMSRFRFNDDLQSYPAKRSDGGPIRKISSPARICSSSHSAAGPSAPLVVQQSLNGLLKDSPLSPPAVSRKSSGSSGVAAAASATAVRASSPSGSGGGGGGAKPKTEDRVRCKETRRKSHINAEQKRRCNIKNGFDTLRAILPSLSQNASTKVSKAAMLQKAAEHVRHLKAEKVKKTAECAKLEKEMESLNQAIRSFHNQLPAAGAPVSCRNSGHTKDLFAQYVRERTLGTGNWEHEGNWKFYIFSQVMAPMLESFDASIDTASMDELQKSTMRWVEQSCQLTELRAMALNSLRTLSTTSSIISDPSLLPQESLQAVMRSSDD